MLKRKDDDALRLLARQLIVQLPINAAVALKVLEIAKEIVERLDGV